MSALIGFLGEFAQETLSILYESGLFILFGFFLAGLLQVYLRTDRLIPFLGGRNLKAVINAALLGAPLPLCSCGVVPTAVALRQKGASREATMSFLISTPETGVDSISITYGLLGPFFAIVRPIVAILTAVVAGFLHMLFGEDVSASKDVRNAESAEDQCADCEIEPGVAHHEAPVPAVVPHATHGDRLRSAMEHGFIRLFDELAFWFLFGILLTGFLTAILPDQFFSDTLGTGLLSMIVVILLGVPLYMCASSSTPVAVAFLIKGLSPGAALVFLLTGPATNAATLSVVGKAFGGRFLKIYLGSIVGVSLAAGLFVNAVYEWSPSMAGTVEEGTMGFLFRTLKGIGLLLFLFLSWKSLRRTGLRPGFRELRENLAAATAPIKRIRPSQLLTTMAGRLTLGALIVSYLLSGFYSVAPGEVGIERHFGRVTRTAINPGLHWCYPWPVGKETTCSTEGFIKLEIGFRGGDPVVSPLDYYRPIPSEEQGKIDRIPEESLFLTGDENLVDVLASAHYRVNDPVRFIFGLENGDDAVRSALLWSMVDEFVHRPLDLIFTTDRIAIEESVRKTANGLLERTGTGLTVEEFRLQSVHSPMEVHYDFRDVASSIEDRSRKIYEAKLYGEEVVHKARGDSASVVAGAEGDRETRLAVASGEAGRFRLLEMAARIERSGTKLRLYLETMERTLPRVRKLVRPDPGAVDQFEIWFQSGDTPVIPELLGNKEGDLR